jgi:hypothetical protein
MINPLPISSDSLLVGGVWGMVMRCDVLPLGLGGIHNLAGVLVPGWQ